MPIPTTNATDELPAVNQILASVGQAPVTTLDQTNPDVAIVYDTLLQVSKEVQAEGWTFNKEFGYKLTPDSNDEIVIANNILQIDLTDDYQDKDAVKRGGKLYERVEHTFKWTTKSEYEFDIVWWFDWVDLPIPIQDYIVSKAATIAAQRIVGDQQLVASLQQREMLSRANAMEYECNQGDFTFFGHPHGSTYKTSYKPYKALER